MGAAAPGGQTATPTPLPGALVRTVQPTAAAPQNPYTMASGALQGAMASTAANMGYRPMQVQATGYNAAMQRGPQTAAAGMGAYQNPYEQAVVDKTLSDVGAASQLGMNQLGAQATAARAFGGSRHGIAEAEMMKGFQQQALDKAAALRQQGFNTALGASQFDVGQQAAAAAANQAAANQAAQFGAQAGMTAQQLNQMAGMQGQQQQLAAAQQLAGLGQQAFGYGQSIQNQQMQQGAMQQQMMQNLINAAKQQYAGYAGQPDQAMNTFMSGISGMPQMGGQQSGYNPGLFNYLQLGASMMPTG